MLSKDIGLAKGGALTNASGERSNNQPQNSANLRRNRPGGIHDHYLALHGDNHEID